MRSLFGILLLAAMATSSPAGADRGHAHKKRAPRREVRRRANWAFLAPGIAGLAIGTVTNAYFWILVVERARDPSSDYLRRNAILHGVTTWGQLAVGIPLLVRGLLGEPYYAVPSPGKEPDVRRVPGGAYLASGIVTTLIGIAFLGAAIPFGRDALSCPATCPYTGIGDSLFGAFMATGTGHIAVGIPLIVRGALGEVIDVPANHWTRMFGMTIQPFAGMNQAGIRGEF